MTRCEKFGPHTLWLGDCRDIMPSVPKCSAVVSDPPYGMNWNTDSKRFTGGRRKKGAGRADYGKIVDDATPFDPEPWLMFDEIILWGANHYAKRLPLGATLVWLKKYPHLYGSFLSDAEIGWHNRGHGVYCMHAPDGTLRRIKEARIGKYEYSTVHPTQKPLALMDWCIGRVKSNIIFDPYMGSGTTGVACIKRGRVFVGVEIEQKYHSVACKRMEAAMRQPDFFVSDPEPEPVQMELT